MIRKLTIENYFSIRERQTLGLKIPVNATDADNRFAAPIPGREERFPRVVAIFGANASGKTNILKSLSFLLDFVRHSVNYKPDDWIPLLRFSAQDWYNKPVKFAVEFDAQVFEDDESRSRYLYELEIGSDGQTVSRESLKHFPKSRRKRLFERDGQKIEFSGEFAISASDPVRNKIRKNASVISTLAQFNHPIATAFYNNLKGVVTDVYATGRGEFSHKEITKYYSENPEVLESLNSEIQRLDFGIKKVTIQSSDDELEAQFIHRGLDSSIAYLFESQGTQNFYKIFPYIYTVLKCGGVAILDELGSYIHPLLLPEIVGKFQDPETNPLNAQLVMSCQNATLLEYLVKEEIFFTEKDNIGRTEIYGLKDISGVRRDANLYSKYLAGVFGGIPNVG